MRTLERLLVVAAVALPMAAFAGAGSVLDVGLGGGLVGAWVGTTLGIATSFVPFLFVIALAAEAFGKPPTEPRDFGAVVWRTVVVVVLLFAYGRVFGGLAGILDGVSKSIAPTDTWDKFTAATQAFLADKATYQLNETVGAARNGSLTDAAIAWGTGQVDGLGGVLIDAVVSIILLAGQAAFRIVGTFGQVLVLLLYVLGPLAIAASVPRGSDAGLKWLRVFVSVLMWPLISALLVGLLSAYALDGLKPNNSYEAAYKSIGLAGILAVTAFAVPVIASALTGAGMGAVSSGWSSMGSWAGAATGGLGAAAAVTGLQGARGGYAPAAPVARAASMSGGNGGGGGLQSAGVVGGGGGGGGGSASPAWARGGGRGIAPAQASVSPAADAAAARDISSGGGVEFPAAAPAPVQPPPFVNEKPWSEGGIVPAKEDDAVPTMKPVPLPGPAAAPNRPAALAGVKPAAASAAEQKPHHGRLVARSQRPPIWDGPPVQPVDAAKPEAARNEGKPAAALGPAQPAADVPTKVAEPATRPLLPGGYPKKR